MRKYENDLTRNAIKNRIWYAVGQVRAEFCHMEFYYIGRSLFVTAFHRARFRQKIRQTLPLASIGPKKCQVLCTRAVGNPYTPCGSCQRLRGGSCE